MSKRWLVCLALLAMIGCTPSQTDAPLPPASVAAVPVSTITATAPNNSPTRTITPAFSPTVTVAYTPPALSTRTPIPTPLPDSGNPLHLVVGVQGKLDVKREGWSDYAPALFGTVLRYGDLLRLPAPSQATLVCADLTKVTLPSGIGGVPCPIAKPILVYAGSLVNPTRSDVTDEYPTIISPRKTHVLNKRPVLRWTAVPSATLYTISFRPDVNWSKQVTTTETVYPASAPPLDSGTTYLLIVTAGGRSSEEDPQKGLGFTVLTTTEVQTIRETEAKIRRLGLVDAPTRFLIANLYATHDLSSEAIEQLEELSSTVKDPAVLRLLGDLYLKIGLNRQAEKRYLQALELSEKANDLEGQALTQYALGLVYGALGNTKEARIRLQNALELYRKMGDEKMINEIRSRLQVAKPMISEQTNSKDANLSNASEPSERSE